MSDAQHFLAQLAGSGRAEARLPLAALGELAAALRNGRTRAGTQFALAAGVTVLLNLAGWTLFKGRAAQAWLEPWKEQVPRDLLFVLSLAILFGPALVAAAWAYRAWKRSSGWRPFDEVAGLLERLATAVTGPVLLRLAIERRFAPLPEDRAVDEWLRLEFELPAGARGVMTGSDHTHLGRRIDTDPSRRSRYRSTNNLRTTLACAVDCGEDRRVNPAAVLAPIALTTAQVDGRWRYRFEKANVLNDSSYRLVSAGDLTALLATALAATQGEAASPG